MVGDEEGAAGDLKGAGGAGGGCCRTALLQEPFEELVRFLARRVADAIEAAVRSKGGQRMGGGNGVNTASVSRGSAMTGTGFTEWGALLLRKEVRTLQQGLASLMETDSLNSEFADINELVRARARAIVCTCGGGGGGLFCTLVDWGGYDIEHVDTLILSTYDTLSRTKANVPNPTASQC